jgi:hypothetical protein
MRAYSFLAIGMALFGVITALQAQDSLLTATGSTATGISSKFNPAMSVNTLMLFQATSAKHEEPDAAAIEGEPETGNGMQVQETEVQLTSFVDPYLKADFVLAQPGAEGLELEEGYVRALTMPAGFGLRVGKFKGAFGKHNVLHSHAFPFVESPLILDEVFGEEGLNEVGIELSALLPTAWYSEILVDATNGDNEVLFLSERARDLGYVARWRNLFDVRPTTTVDIGISGVVGLNDEEDALSNVLGVDLTLKRKPLSATHGKAVLQGEYLRAEVADAVTTGGYGLAQYQFARRWWVQGGFDWITSSEADGTDKRIRAALALVPTEFSALKLQFTANLPSKGDAEYQILFQLNATIGAHPAHAY